MTTAQWILDARAKKANAKKEAEAVDRMKDMPLKQRKAVVRSQRNNASTKARRAGH